MVGFRLGNKVYRVIRQPDKKGNARVQCIAFFHAWKQAWEKTDSKDFPMQLPPSVFSQAYTTYIEYNSEKEFNEAIQV